MVDGGGGGGEGDGGDEFTLAEDAVSGGRGDVGDGDGDGCIDRSCSDHREREGEEERKVPSECGDPRGGGEGERESGRMC